MALKTASFGGGVQQHFTVCVTVYKKEQHCQSVDIGPVHGPDFPGKVLFFPNNGALPSSAASPASMQPPCSPAGAGLLLQLKRKTAAWKVLSFRPGAGGPCLCRVWDQADLGLGRAGVAYA